jgi:uncharacterized Zn finger protein
MAWYGDEFPAYVSAAERRARAKAQLRALVRQGLAPSPIAIEGREIARTFWGKAWCTHLDGLADLASRLPRGRSYVRSGAVLHLALACGEITARVSGTELYEVKIGVAPLPPARWTAVRRACAGRIATAVELLSGKLSSAVMAVLCDREQGLFPGSDALTLACSCPDGAWLCKHLAAVLYGVGARLDETPELIFTLRGVPLAELVADAGAIGARPEGARPSRFSDADLAEIFGIELASEPLASPGEEPGPAPSARRAARRGEGRVKKARTRGGRGRARAARRG